MKAESEGIHEQRGPFGGSCLALGIYFISRSGFSLHPSSFTLHPSSFILVFADLPMVYLAHREKPKT
jgi:hypothetical protein